MSRVAALIVLLAASAPASAQTSWQGSWSANLFLQYNYQQRKFTDFWATESLNWFMGSARRAAGRGTVELLGMLSLEPFTLQDIGSPQVFQTGETFQGGPLIDYQHPHDLIMQLGGRYDRQVGGARLGAAASIVGTPAFGPTPFMHRASAEGNPTAPLSHHYFDAVHVTPGVITGAIEARGLGVDASAFHGREPDEDRLDVDLGALDSWAVRGSWTGGRWSAQASGAHVTSPEVVDPLVDATRLSASVSFNPPRLALLAAWGQIRDVYALQDAYLVEAAWHPADGWTSYGRVESVLKNILTAGGQHPPGFTHPHVYSRVGGVTLGVRRAIHTRHGLRFFVGGDVTGHRTPPNLQESYGQPWSYHVYVQLSRGGAHRHR
jgi:hypothetical protein